MLRKLLQRATLFFLLQQIDVDLAETVRERRCGRGEGAAKCGGPLHVATFQRKPRGGPADLPASFARRLGLCCGWCRRRTLPPSVLFWGRKVYWGAVLLVFTALAQQRGEGHSARRIEILFGIYRSTLTRWIAYFRKVFPQSEPWQLLRCTHSCRRLPPKPSRVGSWLGSSSCASGPTPKRSWSPACGPFVSGCADLALSGSPNRLAVHAVDRQLSRRPPAG